MSGSGGEPGHEAVGHGPASRVNGLPQLMEDVFLRTMGIDSLHTAIDSALDVIEGALKPTWCAIWLFDETTETWFISHSRNLSGEAAELSFSRGSAIPCLVGERGVSSRLDTLDDENSFQRSHEVHYRMMSALYVPMSMRNRPVGVIALYSDKSAYFSEDNEIQLRYVAAHLGQLITALGLLDERGRVHQLDARDRVARDLHDGMLQTLSSLQLYVHSCREAIRDGDMEELAALEQVLSTTLKGAISEVRSQIASLRSLTLLRSLDWMLERMRGRLEAAGLSVALPDSRFEIDPTVSDVLASVAREASNNILKHSDAKSVRFSLARGDGAYIFECSDDGVGLTAESDELRGIGLMLLSETVASIGGTLENTSSPSGGFVLRCTVPEAGS